MYHCGLQKKDNELSSMPTEIEVKLPIDNLKSMRAKIRRRGWRVSSRRQFEANWLFDCTDDSLRNSGRVLRVRQSGVATWLTVKGPVQQDTPHKIREEIEIKTPGTKPTIALLGTLGYNVTWRYEKYRRCFTKAGESGKILLDETPIGNYLELEGSDAWIDNTSMALGFKYNDYITASYRGLFEQYTHIHPVGSNMLFDYRAGKNASNY
jgi:adenylate cyclase class 2